MAFDFFKVPTLTFKLLYCFFVIEHGRRNITRHPTAEVVQQLRETFPETGLYRYAILDHDSRFDGDVIAFLIATGLEAKRTSIRAPRQNGIAEHWVRCCSRELLDPVIVLNEKHLRRLVEDYMDTTITAGLTILSDKDSRIGRARGAQFDGRLFTQASRPAEGDYVISNMDRRSSFRP